MKYKFCICVAVLFTLNLGTAAAQPLSDMEELGKSIFFDEALSIYEDQSCASCHAPEVGWTGPDSDINAAGAVYEGSIDGRFGDRRPPTAAYATTSPLFHYEIKDKKPALFIGGNFWDGRATGEKLGNPAADQAQGPFTNPVEQALPDSACVVWRVCEASYDPSYGSVWGYEACEIDWPDDMGTECSTEGGEVVLDDDQRDISDQAFANIALSIAAYEASPDVNAFSSKWDQSREKKSEVTLNKQERKGYALFQGKGKCAKCHIGNGKKPLFTDYTFDNLGLPQNPDNPAGNAPDFVDMGLGKFLETKYVEFAEDNYGKHKVPTLRNVGLGSCEAAEFGYSYEDCIIKAYGHNGYFKSLKDIVHFYNTRDVEDWPEPEVLANMNTEELGDLGLTGDEEDAIVAFMMTLSDGYEP